MKRPSSLHRRLLKGLLLPLGLILLVSSVLAYEFSLKAAMHVYDLGLMDNAMDLAKQIEFHASGMTLNLPPAALKMLQENNDDRVTFALWDNAGHVFSGDASLFRQDVDFSPGRPVFRDIRLAGQVQRALYLKEQRYGQVFFIAVAQTLQGRNQLRDGIFTSILLPETLLALLTLIVILTGVGFALAPVRRLRSEIVSRSSADLRSLDESDTPTELAPVIHGINELLGNLATSFASHRRFIADASHQLRTPLASLSSQIEVALKHPPEDMNCFLQELLQTTRRTTHLANQLLSLARLEHTEPGMLDLGPVDMDKICREASVDFVRLAATRNVDLEFVLQPYQVTGNPLLLRELLVNLLDNAVHYTPSGGQVIVTLAQEDGRIQLSVEDNGPGVPEEALARLGTPFFRLPSTWSGGCGLGLAIVREIGRLHGAQVLFGRGRESGLRVEVRF